VNSMKCDVVIIGAGPYGLSAAAHLTTIKGLDVRVFGQPMSFWAGMPTGMLLRSNWTATQIAGPGKHFTLEEYQASSGDKFSLPVPLESFIRYGLWYQQQAVSQLDRRLVTRLENAGSLFNVMLQDGELIQSRRVIIAAGIGQFAWRPPEFDPLPSSAATHTGQHHDLRRFANQDVLIVGGGQSALESAALICEAGGHARVIARSQRIHWLGGWASKTLHHRLGALTRKVLYAPTDVGPAGISQLVARPYLLQRLPRALQDKLRARAVRPAGARWLADRLNEVPIELGRSVISAVAGDSKVRVRLDDGTERTVDHVLLGTGYRVDMGRYEFLSPELRSRIAVIHGYPHLRLGLETSVPGLHIVGAPAAWSFGPIMQFVSGSHFASCSLLQAVGGSSARAKAMDDKSFVPADVAIP